MVDFRFAKRRNVYLLDILDVLGNCAACPTTVPFGTVPLPCGEDRAQPVLHTSVSGYLDTREFGPKLSRPKPLQLFTDIKGSIPANLFSSCLCSCMMDIYQTT